ncbi:MAG TPA: tRNA pseudouridine(55) synthase TruB [Armatimonadota bacterium]|nr:tRNA pseudouridine(55) synthase TruB [Armatimonadota bacterium]
MPDGLLNLLKTPGMTSHDLVDQVRRITGMRRVGHSGTLDPAAAGVMIVMLGSFTSLSRFLSEVTKVYRAEITLGVETDTLDGEGRVVRRASAATVTRADVRRELEGLTGELEIAPPLYSAVRQQGRRLYEMARRGESVERQPRPMRVLRFELLAFEPGENARALTEVECSKGTYVRSLAALLGERLGCGAYLSFLVRTRAGAHRVADSLTVAELAELARQGRLGEALVPADEALADFTRLVASPEAARALASGNAVAAWEDVSVGEFVGVLTGDGRLLAVAEVCVAGGEHVIQPRRVLMGADEL